ncbi:ATP-binding protein [Acuticoccus mangrovi]|uniref:ATP-binding protein n=1 Tax=Acuticoccus mangrovi TaxID=2796142 RepID=A0A934MBU9_9HYPH|nr:ATP-binding protein [Acuticoccus mangrovi]MBJ3774537.1 ATP-binding protein [Acuticoccus mangrovi]
MDPFENPFAPGAGSRPPELAGREAVIGDAKIALRRSIERRSAQSQILLGLRGTGKTVLLNEIRESAQQAGHLTSFVEAPENKALAEQLYPHIRQTLRKLSTTEAAKHQALSAMRALRGFASAFKISWGDVELGVDPDPGTADSGDLELDLSDLFEAIGQAALKAERGWVLLIDEVQYLEDFELAAVIVAVHRMAQRNLPVMVFAGGLPQIAKLSGDAKSYAERLFIFPKIDALERNDASNALIKPLSSKGVDITPEALDIILDRTSGYPFFLQEWGHHAWNVSELSPIGVDDVNRATEHALRRLDNGFFKVRFERLTKAEVDYVHAMANLGRGPYGVSDVAIKLGKDQRALGPRRASIIKKGMIYSPSFGDVDFTVPLFDDFLRRTNRSAGARP